MRIAFARVLGGVAGVVLAGVASLSLAAVTCTVGVGNLSFGAYTGTLRTSSSTMTVTCSISAAIIDNVDFTATLSTGQGTYAQRLLRNTSVPVDTLPYNLYLGAVPGVLNTNVWGDGTGGTIVATGSMQLIIIFSPTRSTNFTVAAAMAPVSALPSAGLYSDLISAVVTYN